MPVKEWGENWKWYGVLQESLDRAHQVESLKVLSLMLSSVWLRILYLGDYLTIKSVVVFDTLSTN